MDLLTTLRDNELARNALASAMLLLAALVLRFAALRALQRSKLHVDDQLRWRTQIRNLTITFIGVCVFAVWAQELRAAAISIAAITAALIIATKELLMCLLGSILRASGSSFRVGDRIEINGIRGDVLDIGPLTSTVLEVGPGQAIHQRSGRRITLPNSIFLTSHVINETTSDDFVLHVLKVSLSTTEDWKAARTKLLEIAEHRCAPYVPDARRALAAASPRGVGGNLISTEPAVYLEMPEPGRIELLLRFPAPVRRRGRVAQQILREYLDDAPDPDEEDLVATSHA